MQGNLIEAATIAEKDAYFAGEVQGAAAVLETLAGDLDPEWGLEDVPDLIQDATISLLRAAGGLEGAGPDLVEALEEMAWARRLSQKAVNPFNSGWELARSLDMPGNVGCMGPTTS